MSNPNFPKGPELPNPNLCRSEHDLGSVTYDPVRDIWYECMFDSPSEGYTWAIRPPPDE